ncbi:MAG: hypothetical protein ACKPBF_12310, partial [Actinomycetota bacterium]
LHSSATSFLLVARLGANPRIGAILPTISHPPKRCCGSFIAATKCRYAPPGNTALRRTGLGQLINTA